MCVCVCVCVCVRVCVCVCVCERERESITVPVHTFQSVNRCGGFAFRPVALLIETRLPKVDRNRNVSMMIGEDS